MTTSGDAETVTTGPTTGLAIDETIPVHPVRAPRFR